MLDVIWAGILAPAVRSVCGWAENALSAKSDGGTKVTPWEWALLGETFVRINVINLSAYFGLSLAGVDVPVMATGLGAIVFDFLLKAIRKTETVKK